MGTDDCYFTFCVIRLEANEYNKAKSLKLSTIIKNGEPAGIRTQDTRLKRAVLYQLSYRPAFSREGRILSEKEPFVNKKPNIQRPNPENMARIYGKQASLIFFQSPF
jgi:hypothetical protein